MMTILKFSMVLGSSLSLLSLAAPAKPWGVDEIHKALQAATDQFKETKGEESYRLITGLNFDLNTQKIAGEAQIRYRVSGELKSVSYFCHIHDDEIDCHGR